jgi:hypothetical protein
LGTNRGGRLTHFFQLISTLLLVGNFTVIFDEPNEVRERYERFFQGKIKTQQFDFPLMDHWMQMPRSLQESGVDTSLMLQEYYESTALLQLLLANRTGDRGFTAQIWKTIPTTPGAGKT